MPDLPKALRWVGSSQKDFKKFPDDVHAEMGFSLHLAQEGKSVPGSKPLKGNLSGTVELLDNHDSDTYRAIYTTKIGDVVYVLHAFKKKSKKGAETPKKEIDLIVSRLKTAQKDHEEQLKKDDDEP